MTPSAVISNHEFNAISQVNTANIDSLKEKEPRKKSLNTSIEIQQSLMLTEGYWDNLKGMSIKKTYKNQYDID
ncbi:MAG: hypothetical protein A3E88_07565 [Legionellales bacterium RIFCSPHIGHO2_12_FULL_35_11]|nr:MAG: hypothetical protein A3E88_07565 [Legionellales bacterium RIFCSPHIGHO2_12_FULL_35_11]